MENLIQVLLVLCLTLMIDGKGEEDTNLLLVKKYGRLQGKTVHVKETERAVHAFYGIPFAKPPVGPLRFASPEPAEPWNSIRDATQDPPICLQSRGMIQKILDFLKVELNFPPVTEDCLYLNVFTPADRQHHSKLPVMVFIHGGGLSMGGAFMFDGSALSAHENVVTLSIQYRLGIAGFFSTGDEQAPGNYGFLDQVAALKWVQENIEDFGGDPQSVTIFGESAGGVSVAAHVLSPLSKGLFQRAIAESGVALISAMVVNKVEEVMFFRNMVANISGCDSLDSSVLLHCLKRKTEDEMVTLATSLEKVAIPACVDGEFIPKSPESILAAKESNRVPFIVGVTNHEFGWILPLSMNLSGLKEGMNKDTVQSTLINIPIFGPISEFLPLIMDVYFGDTEDPLEIRNRFLDLCGDLIFVLPSIKTAKYHRDSGLPVFFYEFQHRPSIFRNSKPAFVKADHGDELLFVIGGPFLKSNGLFGGNVTNEEKALSKTLMKYWANFARNGNPNGPGLTEWPEYDEDEDYLEIALNQKPAKKLKEKIVEFWTITIPEKMQKKREEKGEL
ncbi:fatty acyl-CoA hydrolase precursor, medium chain [Bombina bombina]|uniref:fatty acyl-CoA hydrolase precursor, medium chain n=1 Tax=Bombina bombina TaxID=8345 RepID=UPI00235AF7A9|nr:fatty acyl-CoA hydrolase precursor, medium chain [Bombina bombina]